MKKNSFLVILSGILCSIFAVPVDVETAQSAAQSFLTNNNPVMLRSLRTSPSLTLVYTAGENSNSSKLRVVNEPLFYVFNSDESFVIVSGDNAVEPILAYSNDNLFDAQNINPALQYWLDGYEAQIKEVRKNGISASGEITDKWENLRTGKNIRTSSGKGPLVSAKWDQDPYYNDLCPEEAPVGCVAVAMGQAMSYWKYPLKGNGSNSYVSKTNGFNLFADFNTTYDWSVIPDSLSYYGGNSPVEQNELAKLLFHLGVSVEMDYDEGESGAYTFFRNGYRYDSKYSAETAMETFFGYETSSKGISRESYSDSEWLSIIKKEIDEGRPIIYDGNDPQDKTAAHAFVCDGYDEYDRIHLNWGWGGRGDGYFSVNNLAGSTQSQSFNYNDGQGMLIGIQPPQKFQPFDVRLDEIEAEENVILSGEQMKVVAALSNRGTNIFNGDLCAIFYDDNGESVDFTIISDISVSANSEIILDFAGNTSQYLDAGEYGVDIYYKISGGNWLKFDDLSGNESIITIKENDATSIKNINKPNKKHLFKSTIVSDKMEIVLDEFVDVRFVVYDMTGNVVYNAELGMRNAELSWDLRNNSGRFVTNGSYQVVVEAKDKGGQWYRWNEKLGVKR